MYNVKVKILSRCKLLLPLIAACMLLPTNLHATDNTIPLGGRTDHNGKPMLDIQILPNGKWIVYRKAGGAYYKQFYQESITHIFAIKIGNTTFASGIGHANTGTSGFASLTASDVSSSLGGDVQTATKQFTGTYDGTHTFSVDWRIEYDKNDPDDIKMSAAINAANIPAGTDISFAYGFDAYVNGQDTAYAVTSPNIKRNNSYLNGSNNITDFTFTTEEVQSLALAGCINNYGDGSVMAFYPIGGRQFDRAFSAYYFYGSAYASYAATFLNRNLANIFRYSDMDNGLAVAYSNIAPGTTTTIQTGMIFTATMSAELDVTWYNNLTGEYMKHLTVPAGTPVSLRMAANNYNAKVIEDVGFRVNLREIEYGSPFIADAATNSGFTSATHTYTTSGYLVANGIIPALGSGVILAPVRSNTWLHGERTITELNFWSPDMSNILPMSGFEPAVLTFTTEINYLSTDSVTVRRGEGHTYTIPVPAGVTAVNLSYSGATSSFYPGPASVSPVGRDEFVTFTITATDTAVNGDAMTITISGVETDLSPGVFLIGEDYQATITVVVPILTKPSNQTVYAGEQIAPVNFTGSNVVPSECTWTAVNGAAIGLANSGTGNIPAFTAVNTGTSDLTATFTVTPLLGDPETFTITVHPAPTPSGTDFWFVAPEVTTYPGHELPAFLAISNGTYQTANVTITRYNGANPSIVNTEAIAPGTLYKLDLTSAADMSTMANPRGLAGSVTEFGTHITSDVKVTAYYMHNATGSRDIFTLKGRQAFGTLFYVPMQSDNAAPTGATFTNAIDQVDIVATEDSTTVTVTPTTVIRIGASGSSPADTPITRTLNKGETLKIMENVINGVPLAGTKIVADQPVAVTVSEDMIGGGDLAGDQIVPVASLGTRYIVPRGYLTNTTTRPERFYLLGAYADTEVKVYADINNPNSFTTISLNVGTSARYNFPANVYAVYVEATQPVYLYHFSGYGEDGAALIPSVYAIGQTQVNFFQVAVSEVQKGFLLFRTGTENSFTISYGSVVDAPLPLTPIAVPKESEWKVARFDLPASPTAGQVMTIKSSASSFVFGYITGNITNNDSYGYFSDFGTFEFPDTTYMCENSVTLQGGYALSHLWTYPNGVTTSTATSITVTQEGLYTLEMNQDPNIVVATTYVKKINAGTVSPASQFVCEGNQPATLTVAGASDVVVAPFQWQSSTDNLTWTNINGATAATYNPGILNAPSGVTESIYYRRGATSNYCGTVYSNAAEVKVSPCAVIVNPHLRTGVNY